VSSVMNSQAVSKKDSSLSDLLEHHIEL
jgi:hypothetical protein